MSSALPTTPNISIMPANDSPDNSAPKVVYQPQVKENQISLFTRFVEKKYSIELKDYFELHEWSIKNYPEFWDCIWKYFDVLCSTPCTQVFDRKNGFLSNYWFKNVRLNYTENILKFKDSGVALITVDDADNTRHVTYEELFDEVKVYIKALKIAGIQKTDIVACCMPNKIEPVFVFLATAAIGAKFSGTFPFMGAQAILSRFQQNPPKILFTSGNFFFNGTEVEMDIKIPEIVKGLPELEKVVFVPSKKKAEDISGIPKCVFLSEFLQEARLAVECDPQPIAFEQFPFDHPLSLLYTSGTTGAPKCLIHSAGAFIVSLRDFGLSQNCNRTNNVLVSTTVGGINFEVSVSGLHLGMTLTLYEGDVFLLTPTRFWDIVDKFGITATSILASVLEKMEEKGHIPTENHSLKSLKQVFGFGSALKAHSFDFLSKHTRESTFFASAYGATEAFGCVVGFDSRLPVHLGEMQAWSLGMDMLVLDENEQPVIGERGEVVLANPHPGLPLCLSHDEDKKIFKEMYLTKYPGYWNFGDDGMVNPLTKGIVIYGRSDEAMNSKGIKFNCTEIYSALSGLAEVEDSVCVSQFNSRLDERVVLFVKLASGHTLTQQLEDTIKRTIELKQGPLVVPDLVMQAPDIPYNMNGKKMNGLIKKLINKNTVTNAGVVVNPSSIDFFKQLDLGPF